MSFLNPLLLSGLAAVSIPIIIHFLNRRRFRRVEWAAMRFIELSVEKNRKRMDIEDLILLAIRCLLLLLLALALSRPAWRDSAAGALGLSKVTAVILLDNSGSMGLSDGVETRFELARKAAEQVVDGLPSGSAAAVFLATDAAEALLAEPTHDLNLVRKVLREARLSDRASDLQPPIETALETLKGRASVQREVYLITDDQATGWRQLGDIQTVLKRAGKDEDVQTHLILVGQPETRNLAVTDLSLATGLAPVNRPLRFEVEVTNTGTVPVENVQVSLHLDDGTAADSMVLPDIPAGASRAASLFARLPNDGWHTVAARISGDRLGFDDQRVLALRGVRELKTLLIDGDPGPEARAAESFFVRHALTPVPFAERAEYFIKPQAASVAQLGGMRFEDFDLVVMCNVAELTVAQSQLLERFVQRGGGLLIFPGNRVNAAFYNRQLGDALSLLPARLGSIYGDAKSDEKFFHYQARNYGHPIVSLWRNESAGTLASARFYQAYELLPQEGGTNNPAASSVVLRFADEKPAMVEKMHGLGRVILFASTADIGWNDLPVRPAFVPLLHRAVAAVTRHQDDSANIPVGQDYARRVNAEFVGHTAKVSTPLHEGDEHDLTRVEMIATVPTLTYAKTDRAGQYSIRLDETTEETLFAAQPDPRESDLASLTEEDIAELAAVATITRWTPMTSLRQTVEQKRVGAEFWLPLAFLVLALAGTETALAQYFSRSK
jgi:uncharacterized repeat protein (TIGR01451 family)